MDTLEKAQIPHEPTKIYQYHNSVENLIKIIILTPEVRVDIGLLDVDGAVVAKVSNMQLIALNSRVNIFDEYQTKLKACGSEHQEESKRYDCHVTEVKGGL